MNAIDILIIGILVGATALAVISIIRRRMRCKGCCGDCASCAGACRKSEREKEKP